MTYKIENAPRNEYLWCVGYRFDNTKAGINCKPVYGKIQDVNDRKSIFIVRGEKEITVKLNGRNCGYSFTDNYEEAVLTFNIIVRIYEAEYEDKLNRIKEAEILD